MDRPPLTRAAITRVQDSYRQISQKGALAPLFYARLFENHPDTRPLFPLDMAQQHAHFNVALAILVWNLDYLGALDSPLHELGARHIGYGVRREHYAAFRDTLIDLLEECAGDLWSPRLRDDWWDALNQVIAIILDTTPASESDSAAHRGTTGAFRST
jgi:methyl-accepting chemotaxis protein